MRRPSGPAPKSKRGAEVPTVPPKGKRTKATESATDKAADKATEPRNSGIRSRKPPPPKAKKDEAGATVDEVTADLSKDPRRERDD